MVPDGMVAVAGRMTAFLVLATGLFPIWLLLDPSFCVDHRLSDSPEVGAGAFAVAALFLLLTRARRKMPSLAFATILPAVGVAGFAVVDASIRPFYGYGGDVASNLYTGMLWCYVLLFPATAVAALI